MGSDSDLPVAAKAAELLEAMQVPCEVTIASAHRTPQLVAELAAGVRERGIKVVIAAAGGAAHLAGFFAAHTTVPVIGLPISNGPLRGQDALLATVQMPPGVPVATVAIDGAQNAALLACQILATGDALSGTIGQIPGRDGCRCGEKGRQAGLDGLPDILLGIAAGEKTVITRYARPQMRSLWSQESKFQTWLEVELLACEAWCQLGVIPAQAVQEIKDRAGFDLGRISEIEAETRHDVIAFLTAVGERVGPAARYIHYGLTSSDVVDTALSVQMVRAVDILLKGLADLKAVLREQAIRHRATVMVGRTHGIHAEPVVLGLKFALWLSRRA